MEASGKLGTTITTAPRDTYSGVKLVARTVILGDGGVIAGVFGRSSSRGAAVNNAR